VDMNHHSLGIDIGNLEIESFLEPEPQGVHDCEEAQHGWLLTVRRDENMSHAKEE